MRERPRAEIIRTYIHCSVMCTAADRQTTLLNLVSASARFKNLEESSPGVLSEEENGRHLPLILWADQILHIEADWSDVCGESEASAI